MSGKTSDRIDPSLVWDCVVDNFKSIAVSENLPLIAGQETTDELVERFMEDINASHVDLQDYAKRISIDRIKQRLSSDPAGPGRRLPRVIVAPCSTLIDEVIASFVKELDDVVLVDSFRDGHEIAGKPIFHPDDFEPNPQDVCLILTRNQAAVEFYRERYRDMKTINLIDAVDVDTPERQQRTATFLEKVNQSPFPVTLSSSQPKATLLTLTTQLMADGVDAYWIVSQDVFNDDTAGYGTPKSSDIDVSGYLVSDWKGLISLFCQQRAGVIIFHYEDGYAPAWDFRRVAICYALGLAVCRAVKQMRVPGSTAKLLFLMYDAVKPGIKNYESGTAASRIYRQLMLEAEGIVFSSYTKPFGDFVEQAVGSQLPRVHFHRYQVSASKTRPRRSDGYHIALVSVALEEFFEPSRTGLKPYLRNVISQGIHLHYYAAATHHETIEQFRASLPEEGRGRFHLHRPIRDLHLLSEELSEYHAGWCLLNMYVFNEMTVKLEDQFMRDAMDIFTPTTLPSVMWTCAAAGLPVICNRSMYGVQEVLPKELSIPLYLSEVANLRQILDGIDWQAVDAAPRDHLDMANRIQEFYSYLKDLTGRDAVPSGRRRSA